MGILKKRAAQPADAEQERRTEQGEKPPYDPHKDTYEWIHCIVVAVIVCVLLFVLLARVIDVQGQSMEPTLHNGDKIIITRLAGGYEYGDIVVLQKDSFKPEPIVKRVIATEGQTLTIDYSDSSLYVDGKKLNEPYIKERTIDRYDIMDPAFYEVYGIDPEKDVVGDAVTVTVPESCVFVMGDNRNNSSDSRVHTINFVDTRLILGKAVFRIFPFNRVGALYGAELSVGGEQPAAPVASAQSQGQTAPADAAEAQSGVQEIGQIVDVKGSAMAPTLLDGDKLSVIGQEAYVTGDIVAVNKDAPIVKRVIATGGQTVTLDFQAGTVAVDGETLDEPYVTGQAMEPGDIMDPAFYEAYGIVPTRDIAGSAVTVTVPEGCLFVLSDDRSDTGDSRSASVGFVAAGDVLGKATMRVSPLERIGSPYGAEESDG